MDFPLIISWAAERATNQDSTDSWIWFRSLEFSKRIPSRNANKNTDLNVIQTWKENKSEIIVVLVGNSINAKCNSFLTTQFIESKNWKQFYIETRFFHLICFCSSLILSHFAYAFYFLFLFFVCYNFNYFRLFWCQYIHKMSHLFVRFDLHFSAALIWNGMAITDVNRKENKAIKTNLKLKKKNNNKNRTMEQSSVYSKDNNSWFTGWCFISFCFLSFPFHHDSIKQSIRWDRRSRTKSGKKSQIKCPLPFQMNYRQIKGRKF